MTRFKISGKENDKNNFKCAKLLLKKIIRRKNFILKKKTQKIRKILKNSGEL